jgi:phosphatidylglycerol:prolipoprotein diacylglycerol transferase
VRPILFQIGPIPIYSYGAMVALAFIIALWFVSRQAQERGLASSDKMVDLSLWILVGGVIGARLLFVLLEWSTYIRQPWSIFLINQGGLSFYGAVLGGFIGGIAYAKKASLPVWPLADVIIPWVALGYSIVRIGCLLNGCCYGVPTHVPWALRCAATDNLLRHPTQIYALLASLGIFVLLMALQNRKPFAGFIFWLYTGVYAIARFIIEIYRESQILAFGWLRTTQVACVFLLLLSAWMIYRGCRMKGRVLRVAGEETAYHGE